MQRMQKQNRKLSKQFFVRGQHPIPTTLNALSPTLIYCPNYLVDILGKSTIAHSICLG